MRIALIVVAIAVATSPSLASPSCMTQSEARQKFPKAHLWWHGPNRCWDATAPRHRLAQRNKAKEPRAVVREAESRETPEPASLPPNAFHAKWRDAMSRMLPDDGPSASPSPPVRVAGEPATSRPPPANWLERWVDIKPSIPPIVDRSEPADISALAHESEPIVTPLRVMLALLALVLTIGVVELLLRRTLTDRPR